MTSVTREARDEPGLGGRRGVGGVGRARVTGKRDWTSAAVVFGDEAWTWQLVERGRRLSVVSGDGATQCIIAVNIK